MADDYGRAIAAASLLYAELLVELEKDAERRERKSRVVAKKRDMLRETFPDETSALTLHGDEWKLIQGRLDRELSIRLLIDLVFSNPYAPFELEIRPADARKALGTLAEKIGLASADLDRILKSREDALKAHRHIEWKKVATWGIGGVVAVGLGGWIAAPLLGGMIGTAAGLSGIAATKFGLAVLGGGSLALGGAGMAGGMWLVTAAGIAIGGTAFGGGALLLQIGAAASKVELVKLQISYREMILGGQTEARKAQEVVAALARQRDEIKTKLQEERALNDANSARLKDMEETLRAVEDAIGWMKAEEAKAA